MGINAETMLVLWTPYEGEVIRWTLNESYACATSLAVTVEGLLLILHIYMVTTEYVQRSKCVKSSTVSVKAHILIITTVAA